MLLRASLVLCLLPSSFVMAQSSAVYSYSYAGAPLPAHPYAATFESKTVKTLADGTTITSVVHTKEARDSQGRTFHQVTTTLPDGQQHMDTFVFDPGNRTNVHWSSGSKVAIVDHLPDPATQIHPRPPVSPEKLQPAPRSNDQRESLGTKTILGVDAIGSRMTRVIPAGSHGNDRPITVVMETWRSSELGIMLSTTRDDPEQGRSTQEVIELDRGEPDPAVFQPPADYTLQEHDRSQER